MIFATVAIVCTMSACNNYHIDTAESFTGAVINTSAHTVTLERAMQEEHTMVAWLNQYKIGETVFEIVSIDLETEQVEENEIP